MRQSSRTVTGPTELKRTDLREEGSDRPKGQKARHAGVPAERDHGCSCLVESKPTLSARTGAAEREVLQGSTGARSQGGAELEAEWL